MTKRPAPESVTDIDRNDIDACIAFYNAHGVTSDQLRTMLKLQDDARELERVSRDWRVTPID